MLAILSHKYFKLLLLTITALGLLLKSPLVFISLIQKIGLNQTNPNVEIYFWLEFILWLLAATPLLMFVFSKLSIKEFVVRYKSFLLIVSNFVFASFRSFKSFDVTDNGFHLSKAWGAVHGGFDLNIDFWFGASVVNGLWLSIISYPLLLWARMGWVITVCLIVFFTYKIIALYYQKLISFLVVFTFSFLFIKFNYYLTINYDNLPLLLSLVAVYLILKNDLKLLPNYYLTISGMLLGISFFIKFNYLLIFTLPLIVNFYSLEYRVINLKTFFKRSGYIYLGIAAIMLFLFSSLLYYNKAEIYYHYLEINLINRTSEKSTEQAKAYSEIMNFDQSRSFETINNSVPVIDSLYFFLSDSLKNDSLRTDPLYKNSGDSHNLKSLFNSYFTAFWHVTVAGVLYLLILLFTFFMINKVKGNVIKFILLLAATFFFYYSSKIHLEGSNDVFLTALIIPGYILFFITNRSYKLSFLSLNILLIALFSFPGSDLVFNVIYRSGAGLLLMSFPVIYLWDKKYIVNNSCTLNFSDYSKLLIVFMVFAIYSSWDYVNSHRDLERRDLLITMFKSPQLFGIHSTPQRVKVVDELLTYFAKEKYERNNTPALFVNWIPMFYYLTETNCMFSAPWHVSDQLKYFTTTLTDDKPKPKYITISEIFTRNPNWPLMDKYYKTIDKGWIVELRINDFTRYYIKRHHYQKVFQNEMFEVYKLPVKNIQIDTLKSIEAVK